MPGVERRVVYLGHLVERQGVDVLLRAVALLNERGSPVSASVIGGGPLESDLRDTARRLGIGELVVFHGFVESHLEVERLLASASIAVAPYRPSEGSFSRYADPGKAKAYLAAGLPILLTDVPPNANVLAQRGGAEIVPFDHVALASAIARVLDDRDSWNERHVRALEYAKSFDWEALLSGVMSRIFSMTRVGARRSVR